MSFLCPKCTNNTLNIIKKIELPPDSRSDETSVQVVQCQKCGLQGVARAAMELVIQVIEKCPDNNNSKCKCSARVIIVDNQ